MRTMGKSQKKLATGVHETKLHFLISFDMGYANRISRFFILWPKTNSKCKDNEKRKNFFDYSNVSKKDNSGNEIINSMFLCVRIFFWLE